MRARLAWAVVAAVLGSLLASAPAHAAGPTPDPVPSVTATNPEPDVLVAGWSEPLSGAPALGYVVRVRALDTTVVAQAGTTALTATFEPGPGTFTVTVAAVGTDGEATETASAPVTVASLVRTATVSANVVRPFRDGFQDSVAVRATSTFPASGAVRVLDASGRAVRTYALGTGTSWSAAFDGRTAAGRVLAYGYYRLQFELGGTVFSTRGVTVASSQVGTPARRFSAPRFYPVVDGYRDTVRLTVTTSVPATMSVVLTGITGAAKGKVFGRGSLSRRTSGTFTWKGRYRGRVAPAGTYRAAITVVGGEGRPRTAYATVAVSGKRRVVESFDLTVSATKALDRMAYGALSAGSDPGGQRLRGCTTAGCQPDMGLYSAELPASASAYAGVKVTACVRTTSGKPAGRFSYTNPGRGVVGPIYSFATGGAGCYVPAVAPGTSVRGRTIFWLAANVDTRSRSAIDLAYFRLTGRRSVLR